VGRHQVLRFIMRIDLPRPFLRKILQTLSKNGILKSYKGKGGGFELKIPFKDITLYMIEEVFTPKMKRGDCPFKNKICSNFSKCHLKMKIYEIENRFVEELSKIKLVDLWR
jgi:Rrf2 family iron-sulfur cluster assembly transcriptional regulator